ncbi:conserved hypothetical protein [Beutenbergia cavernae DSM 12333]|uniref:Adenylylsulfate kinase n=1 Tax=Beutenbergia cavernae (strain ATCC BAA-8 / DSM 12333 / CCUG 43141 / JCM 11478 / NBRC 16432 / NCIMB 13614 / HKI 0122) TaxID=471853 RepID=C5BUV6_BEUC1|nr:AAA family ATPase [Beutenbergia cavernae]ACQ78330.1 conserved hypothetical protein [Beutenbergia cavernae DSM 12333]
MPAAADAVLVTGTVGVGKTSVGESLSAYLEHAQVSHALIDTDAVRRMWPSPADDPFHLALELANVAAVAANYRGAGAQRFVVTGVLERGEDRARYAEALGAERLFVARLTADEHVVRRRLIARHDDDPDGLRWHLARRGELEAILDAAQLEDVLVDTTRLSPRDAAERIAASADW